MINDQPHRRSYADEPGLLERVFSLLDLGFPGLPAHARALEPLGLQWDQVSTPFLSTSGDQALAHVGVLELPMVASGRDMPVGGIHAVCTHPDHRRQGHFRSAMSEALAWCDKRYAAVMLIAGDPEIYEPFGFHVVKESRFVAQARRCAKAPDKRKRRRLDLHQPGDLRLLHRLLDERAPVSRRLGVKRGHGVFLFNQATKPMWYAEDLDAILCLAVGEGVLRVHDLVAARIPTLQEVIDPMQEPFDRVEVYFAPDQLGASLSPEPHAVDQDGLLMVRGELPPRQAEVMLPYTARF